MDKNGFTKARYKYLAISSIYIGDKPARFMTNNYNNSKITVTNTVTKKRVSFDFWSSINSPEIRCERELLEALLCILSDACSAIDSDFEGFCDSYGYNNDSISALDTYKECQKIALKLSKVIDDIPAIYNGLLLKVEVGHE